MALILSIDTSTSVCSVALHNHAKIVALVELHIQHAHASKLARLIEEVKMLAGVTSNQLEAVAIGSGPGSYTGLRIGTSTAKGICYGLNIPLISFNTLELMAFQVNTFNKNLALLCPMIDARRMEVYCTLIDANRSIIQRTHAKVIDDKSFEENLQKSEIWFFGDGSQKCKPLITHFNAHFVDNIYPSAAQLGI